MSYSNRRPIFEDKLLRCIECGKDFVFTSGEQNYFWDKGLKTEPKRCPACRERRKGRLPSYIDGAIRQKINHRDFTRLGDDSIRYK